MSASHRVTSLTGTSCDFSNGDRRLGFRDKPCVDLCPCWGAAHDAHYRECRTSRWTNGDHRRACGGGRLLHLCRRAGGMCCETGGRIACRARRGRAGGGCCPRRGCRRSGTRGGSRHTCEPWWPGESGRAPLEDTPPSGALRPKPPTYHNATSAASRALLMNGSGGPVPAS